MWLKAGASLRNAIASLAGIVLGGPVTIPAQPSFFAYNSTSDANATGAGTEATGDFDTEVTDRGGNFSADTFTTPAGAAGVYNFATNLRASAVPAGSTSVVIKIVTSNRTYQRTRTGTAGVFSTYSADLIALCADMDVGDTAYVTLTISGGAGNTASIDGASFPITWFGGHLAA